MSNNIKIFLVFILLVVIGFFVYQSSNKGPAEPIVQAPVANNVENVLGCYIANLAKDVYTLNIKTQVGANVTGTLAFKNFEKDSSGGTFVGTYQNGTLLGDYSFASEGMNSVLQTIFKKSGNTFIRGYGEMNATGDRFADLNKITFDPNQIFISSTDCI